MRLVIIVLVVIAIGFAVTIGWGLAGGPGPRDGSDGAPPTRANGEVDEDRLEDWQPPSLVEAMNGLLAPFAPALDLAQPHLAMSAGGTANRTVPAAATDLRLARLHLTAGLGARITLACVPAAGRSCPQSLCLCRPGTALDESLLDGCPKAWRKARRENGRIRCREGDADGQLLAYPEGGALQAGPLGNGGAELDIQ